MVRASEVAEAIKRAAIEAEGYDFEKAEILEVLDDDDVGLSDDVVDAVKALFGKKKVDAQLRIEITEWQEFVARLPKIIARHV